ncbi:DgyrCDS2574 [Dimorphilus gyrociliatus]|uniref:DgyrCDS2574 n=1 Tax=Dimorphilus gyrociliatus TaxID=2664684 RepID=A0A7I8VAQ1_9ANNE|nr:DgyrCDS2574 [Dimorphilus gyrociliatus]
MQIVIKLTKEQISLNRSEIRKDEEINYTLKNYCDLSNLNNIHIGSILMALIQRYKDNRIYTKCGRTLFALNPMKTIKSLYNNEKMIEYLKGLAHEPHIYQIAEETFQNDAKVNSIVVTGESGSGKTENVKHLINYFASRNGHLNEKAIERRLIESNALLEAMGNAKTNLNTNSSRFVKLIRIYFDSKKTMVGANIDAVLLEKMRVHSLELSNFHIFYQLLGLPKSELTKYLGKYGINENEGQSNLNKTINSLRQTNFEQHEIDGLMQLIASLILLKRIDFEKEEDCAIAQPIFKRGNINEALNLIENALLLDYTEILRAISTRQLRAGTRRKSVFVVQYSAGEAKERLNSFIEFLYCRTFSFIVKKINQDLSPSIETIKTIQILDIFGFESMEVNSLEQLSINFANEKLQDHYLTVCVIDKQKKFVEEGLDVERNNLWKHVSKTSDEISELLFSALNDPVVMKNNFAKKAVMDSLCLNCQQSKLIKPKPHTSTFVISHYAKNVEYSIIGMVEKNSAADIRTWTSLISNSESSFIRNLIDNNNVDDKKFTTNRRRHTLLTEHRVSVENLIKLLEKTEERFVRCFKPSNITAQNHQNGVEINGCYLYQQLKNSGIVQEVYLTQKDYPYFHKYDLLHRNYRLPTQNVDNDKELRDAIEKFLESLNIPEFEKSIKFGKTGIFMNDLANNSIENYYLNIKRKNVITITKYWKSYILRKKLKTIVERNRAALKIQKFIRRRSLQKNTAVMEVIHNNSLPNGQGTTSNGNENKKFIGFFSYGNPLIRFRTSELNYNLYESSIHSTCKRYGSYKLNQHSLDDEID